MACTYNKDAARYLWFVVRGDGTISEGNEYREDGKDALSEVREYDSKAKLVRREKLDPIVLADFYKRNGVPTRMLAKGYRDAVKDEELGE